MKLDDYKKLAEQASGEPVKFKTAAEVLQPYQPKTGEWCHCKPGVHRDNCPDCEGTGMRIDFAKIRATSVVLDHIRTMLTPAQKERFNVEVKTILRKMGGQ